jgi:hypothetical protein
MNSNSDLVSAAGKCYTIFCWFLGIAVLFLVLVVTIFWPSIMASFTSSTAKMIVNTAPVTQPIIHQPQQIVCPPFMSNGQTLELVATNQCCYKTADLEDVLLCHWVS